MAAEQKPRFTIVGAGLAGALMACYLGKGGQRVDVYEKRPDPRDHDQDRGRSINLALSVRGIDALQEVGLADDVLRDRIPMRGRMIHSRDGTPGLPALRQRRQEVIHSVSRAGLNLALVKAAAQFASGPALLPPQVHRHRPDRQATIELVDEATRQRPDDGERGGRSGPTGPIPRYGPRCRSTDGSITSRST